MMKFEKEDMRMRSMMQEKAEQMADGSRDNNLWG
jgi:hypothetical protein